MKFRLCNDVRLIVRMCGEQLELTLEEQLLRKTKWTSAASARAPVLSVSVCVANCYLWGKKISWTRNQGMKKYSFFHTDLWRCQLLPACPENLCYFHFIEMLPVRWEGKQTFWSNVTLQHCSVLYYTCFLCSYMCDVSHCILRELELGDLRPSFSCCSLSYIASFRSAGISAISNSDVVRWKHAKNLDDWPSTPPPSTPSIPAFCYLLRGRRRQRRPGCLDEVIMAYQWHFRETCWLMELCLLGLKREELCCARWLMLVRVGGVRGKSCPLGHWTCPNCLCEDNKSPILAIIRPSSYKSKTYFLHFGPALCVCVSLRPCHHTAAERLYGLH